MYRSSKNQFSFPDFILPFGGHLDANNRWVKLADMVPWESVEEAYLMKLSSNNLGSPAKSARIAFGALIIKERMGITDEETVQQIKENPYLQYFLGYDHYLKKEPFNPSMMTHFRTRFASEALMKINEEIVHHQSEPKNDSDDSDEEHGDGQWPEEEEAEEKEEKNLANRSQEEESSNHGKLLIDATCTPADIRYPTDLGLLNEAREKLEGIIDVLYSSIGKSIKKPRDYRRMARKDFLQIIRQKHPGKRKLRTAIGKQLRYLRRDLGHIDSLLAAGASLGALARYDYKCLLVIHTLYEQQNHMYRERTHKVAHRIVSISQPHVRPIVRGKAGARTEFGAKISVSHVDGYVYVDRLSWEAYNECHDLPEQVEAFRRRHGHYPASVHADKIYRTRANRKYCTQRGIRLSGMRPGALPKDVAQRAALRHQVLLDERARNPVEGSFGNAKRRGTMARIMAKLEKTSRCVIHIGFILLNLNKRLRESLFALIFPAFWQQQGHQLAYGMNYFVQSTIYLLGIEPRRTLRSREIIFDSAR